MNKEPLSIRNITLPSRIVMPPMATAMTKDGYVTNELIDYYVERARNPHIGLIITEHVHITPEGKAHASQVSIDHDACIEGLKKLTDAMHQEGMLSCAQISHAGNVAKNDFTPLNVNTMTKEDIERIVKAFAEASVRAEKAGYDAVEIHSAHRYLLNQFYSPITNKRSDEYGPQNIENRTRIHLEVIKAVRSAVGEDFPIFIRLGGCDYQDGGSTIEDAVQASVLFEKAGADVIDLSGGFCSYRNPFSEEPGYFKDMSSEVKKAVSIPVLLTGGITTLAQADALLAEEAADLIGVGRAILKDAMWETH